VDIKEKKEIVQTFRLEDENEKKRVKGKAVQSPTVVCRENIL